MIEPDVNARARKILSEMDTQVSHLHAMIKAAPEAGAPGWVKHKAQDVCEEAVAWVKEARAVDLPAVTAPGGCLTFPAMPDFGALYTQAGFCYPASDYDRDETLEQARRLKDAAASLQALFPDGSRP
ncbi:hypothetical protein [Streptomyces melanogenes]|uniref:hypothetical protein n=1 Tax=Streptomyces melanogenes TaxID=67326 RepID=UPI00167DA5D4|nr:hypothetical protein [Streptomyces melanogenes]